jgi:hypothetical protein
LAAAIVTYKGRHRLIEGPDEFTLEKFIRKSFPGRVRKLHGGRFIVKEGK